MSFRRSSDASREVQRWRTFLRNHGEDLEKIGMPELILKEKDNFDHWLMHGHHPLDPSGFVVEQVDKPAREILVRVIRAYADAGFSDPGISILSEDERRGIFRDPKQHGRRSRIR